MTLSKPNSIVQNQPNLDHILLDIITLMSDYELFGSSFNVQNIPIGEKKKLKQQYTLHTSYSHIEF